MNQARKPTPLQSHGAEELRIVLDVSLLEREPSVNQTHLQILCG